MRDLSGWTTFPFLSPVEVRGAHFHLWFYPRPYGQLQLRGTFLGMWSVLLPDLPDDEVRAAGERVARVLG